MRLRMGVLALLIVATAGRVYCQQEAMEKLECLGSALRAEGHWLAAYHQTYTPIGMAFGEEERGTVWVSWPDKALFRAGEPVVRLMGLHGRQLRLVDLEVPSCDDHHVDDAEWERIPLAAVLDPRGAVHSFVVTESGDNTVTLIPREPGGVDRVEVALDALCLPREVLVVDPQGATNRLVFSTWQPGDGPPAGKWLPEPPEGLECSSDP